MIFLRTIFQTILSLLSIYILANVLYISFENSNLRYFLLNSEILINYLIFFWGVKKINSEIKDKKYLFLKLFSITIIIIIIQIFLNYAYDYFVYNFFPKLDPYIDSSKALNIDYNGPNFFSTFYNLNEPILNPGKFLSEFGAYSIVNNLIILVQTPIIKALIIAFFVTYIKGRK